LALLLLGDIKNHAWVVCFLRIAERPGRFQAGFFPNAKLKTGFKFLIRNFRQTGTLPKHTRSYHSNQEDPMVAKKNSGLSPIYRSRLEADLKRLTDQIEQMRALRVSEDRREGSPFGKREEEATETADLENGLAMEKKLLDQIAETEYALDKYTRGIYGLCEMCKEPIDPARLEALPQARLCMQCKSKSAKSY
jgi:RNA polymerase-binding transcription factor DksA